MLQLGNMGPSQHKHDTMISRIILRQESAAGQAFRESPENDRSMSNHCELRSLRRFEPKSGPAGKARRDGSRHGSPGPPRPRTSESNRFRGTPQNPENRLDTTMLEKCDIRAPDPSSCLTPCCRHRPDAHLATPHVPNVILAGPCKGRYWSSDSNCSNASEKLFATRPAN